MLDDFRAQPKADMDVLAELTRILAPPTWVTLMQLSAKQVIGRRGDAGSRAAALGARFVRVCSKARSFKPRPAPSRRREQFRIKTNREESPSDHHSSRTPACCPGPPSSFCRFRRLVLLARAAEVARAAWSLPPIRPP